MERISPPGLKQTGDGPGAIDLHFVVNGRPGAYRVRLACAGYDDVEAEFAADVDQDSRLMKTVGVIDENNIKPDDLRDVGSQLFAGLVTGDVGALYDAMRKEAVSADRVCRILLRLPPELEDLPWEALYDLRIPGFLAANEAISIIRVVAPGVSRPVNRPHPGTLRILVAIPSNTGLQVAYEWSNLTAEAAASGISIELERMSLPVTPDRLRDHLTSKQWDIFHFAGHGRIDEHGEVNVVLTGELGGDSETELNPQEFTALLLGTSVQLAVLNCCLGARASAASGLSGLGPHLIAAGLHAVVAMRYEIPDPDALRFAQRFYRKLLAGAARGNIDAAAANARVSLFLNQQENRRNFITPALYATPELRPLANIEMPSQPIPERVERVLPKVSQSESWEPPDRLIRDLMAGKCVLLTGPDLLSAPGAVRSANGKSPPGPRELAQQLAGQYADSTEVSLALNGPDWAAYRLLQRVCQQFSPRDPEAISRVLWETYAQFTPGELLRSIARWNAPGVLCSYFDGLLARAFEAEGRGVRVINQIDQPTESTESAPLIVHLRGSIDDPDSLVLTERDHENYRARLQKITSSVSSLMTKRVGQSFLCLGVSPQDEVIRQTVRWLLPGESRARGPLYFVCPVTSPADNAYWNGLRVEWLNESPATVIHAVGAALENGI